MRAILFILIVIASARCVDLPPVPRGPDDSMALPFICSIAGVPIVGGWIVISAEDWDEYGKGIHGWTACGDGEIVSCAAYGGEVRPAGDL